MKDILLVDDDLYVTDTGDIRLTDRVSQAAKIRLRWFKNEWGLGPRFGMPYYDEFLVKNPNIPKLKRIISDELMTINEVTDVANLEISVDPRTRDAHITFTLICGEEYYDEEVTISA